MRAAGGAAARAQRAAARQDLRHHRHPVGAARRRDRIASKPRAARSPAASARRRTTSSPARTPARSSTRRASSAWRCSTKQGSDEFCSEVARELHAAATAGDERIAARPHRRARPRARRRLPLCGSQRGAPPRARRAGRATRRTAASRSSPKATRPRSRTLVAWCHQGPPAAHVASVHHAEEPHDERLGAFGGEVVKDVTVTGDRLPVMSRGLCRTV